MAGFITANKIQVPINSDPYNLTADLRTMAETSNVPIPVNSQAERDALTSPIKKPGTIVERLDVSGVPFEVWDGSGWVTRWNDTDWFAPSIYGNGFNPYNGAPWDGIKLRMQGGVVVLSGPAVNAVAWSSGAAICNIQAPYKPDRQIAGFNCNITTAGDVLVTSSGGAGASVTVFATWMLP